MRFAAETPHIAPQLSALVDNDTMSGPGAAEKGSAVIKHADLDNEPFCGYCAEGGDVVCCEGLCRRCVSVTSAVIVLTAMPAPSMTEKGCNCCAAPSTRHAWQLWVRASGTRRLLMSIYQHSSTHRRSRSGCAMTVGATSVSAWSVTAAA